MEGNDSVVFDGTPLATYLQEQDESHSDGNDLSGWGIEPPLEEDTSPSGGRIFEGIGGPLPLILNAESGKASLRRHRFKKLIKNALQAKLNDSETGQFLERFRYVVVSSDLLDKRVAIHNNLHEIDPQDSILISKDQGKRNILFGDEGPWTVLKMHEKYWVGGGGCVVVMVTLLSWGAKTHKRTYGNAMLVVVLCMGLYLFSHSRRRVIRMLRAKAIAYASHFVRNNQHFDHAITKCISLITEVDLLSQGYRPDLSDRKFGSSAMDSRMAAKHLRSGLSATLYLALNAYIDAVSELLRVCNHLDLMRYLDIYDVRAEELGLTRRGDRLEGPLIVLSRETYYGPDGANASLYKLKQEFVKLHLLRRTLMCCLLSVPSAGECTKQELDSWGVVTYHLKTIGQLLQQLSKAVINQRRVQSVQKDLTDHTVDWRGHTRSINEMSSTLQHIEARLQVLADSSLDQTDYHQHYDLVGEEIRNLLESWERGYQDMGGNNEQTSHPATMIGDDTPIITSPIPQQHEVFQTIGANVGHRRTDTCSTSSSMTIIQGMSEDDVKRRNVMPRHERIKLMQQAREMEKERKQEIMTKQTFVNELDTVLKRRSVL